MSFRGDDQRRYGHVPPVQYPVAGQSLPDRPAHPARSPSFNNGDDATGFPSAATRPPYHPTLNTTARGLGVEDELFLAASPTVEANRANYGNSNAVMSSYQQSYQSQTPPTPSTYDPRAFIRSQSTTLPPNPRPAHRWPQPNVPSAPYSPTATTGGFAHAPYNPAAYSNSTVPQRQPTYAGHSHTYNSPSLSSPTTQSSYFQSQSIYAPQPAQAPAQITMPTPPTTYAEYDQTIPTSTYGTSSGANATASSYAAAHEPSQSQHGSTYWGNGRSPPATSYSSATSQAPYPTSSHIPVGPNYSDRDPHSFLNLASDSNSTPSPVPSPHASPALARHPTNAPLPSRPVDNGMFELHRPNGASRSSFTQEHITQDNIMQEIEAGLGRVRGSQRSRPNPYDQRNERYTDDHQPPNRFPSTASYHSNATTLNSEEPSGVNRYSSNASTLNRNSLRNPNAIPEDDGDESDPEGAAGALALWRAEEEDRRLSSFGSGPFPLFSQPEVGAQTALPTHKEEPSSDSDYTGMDLGLAGGGYNGQLAYDNNLGSPPNHETAQFDSHGIHRSHASQRSHDSANFPAFKEADLDYAGCGGLQPPRAHRLSFDDGDERVSLHSRPSSSESPHKDDYPDMFYHPGIGNRPLPAIPPGSDSSSLLSVQSPGRSGQQHGYSLSTDSRPYTGPDAYYGQNAQQLQVERSISLSSHSTSPHVQPPGRSKTDAAEERNARMRHIRQQQQHAAQQGLPYDGYETGTPSSVNYDVITLPTGRRRKFQPEKLASVDVQSCTEPWALSGIAKWIREMADGEPDLKRKTVEDGLVRLFCLKVPTMNVADAETLSAQVVKSLLQSGILVPEEEWLKFGHGSISGVLWQLTGIGCYAPKLHENQEDVESQGMTGRCYSFHCMRTLKKANIDKLMLDATKTLDWASFYQLTKESLEDKSKHEIKRQNILHECITTEESYMDQLEVLRILYRDRLVTTQPRIISDSRMDKFVNSVFGKAEAVQRVNKDHLLAQMKYRQKEQGPWLTGLSDIFREWVRKARTAYIEYAAGFPYASFLIRREYDRNVMFRQFLDSVRNDPRSKRLNYDTYIKAPITRLQRYPLLLESVLKGMKQDTEEKVNMAKAIEEIKAVAHECDAKVAEQEKKVTMIELDQMLVMRPGFHADLNLDHLGRELILEGDLQRMGSKGVRWVDSHALLFDHYLILAKLVYSRDSRQEKKYDVSKEPIPMPLLFLESSQDDPISKQKGIATPLTRSTNPGSDTRLNKVTSNASERPGLEHTATSASVGSAMNRLAPINSGDSEGKILYPFRIKHLGHEVYTLFASSAQSRQDWCDRIIEAKTRHAKALHTQNAEPFKLRVMADSAFAYDSISGMGKYMGGVHIRGTPLDRAIRELEKTVGPGRGPPPISRAAVYCATGFSAFGKNMVAVGTDVGVCVAEASDQRGWSKTVSIGRVTQIAVLEEFSVVLVLSDRSLISYPLDVVSPPSSHFPTPSSDNPRRSPQRLAKDVTFFATARMKDRMLVFYKRKENLHSTFKILEPVYQKATEKKSRLFGGSRRIGSGATETFRDYDEFYLPTECYSLNIFQSYIAIATAKGFELMTLDKKVPMSIPDTKQPAIAGIASRVRDQRPLGMFRLNDQEYILAYEDCAVYIDKHGDVSRSVIMEYSGKQKKAKGATVYGEYLILFNDDYVEVRNAENGRLRQIIAGRDVRVLDYGIRGPTGGFYNSNGLGARANGTNDGPSSKGTVKIAMAHPEVAGQQIVLEMLLNNGHMEK
ncbi:putative Rho1 guanine nucleotide exchange factor 3 [Rosellinia necatrix]|uniref:Putative Rho1 guanine nucleotide exchange factor 3 n=1 Tax=Rosellinia necatrix TaxID=77044 RepID=A0A1W2TIR5_ROSNE|nr:putative Rho1 guanine nucleotide exchange factor 3 [Rosellinia necatrix]